MDVPSSRAVPGRLARLGAAQGPLVLGGSPALVAAAVYVLATLDVSLLDPSYSQIRHHISDLTATGAVRWAARVPFNLLYNILSVAFAIARFGRGFPYRPSR